MIVLILIVLIFPKTINSSDETFNVTTMSFILYPHYISFLESKISYTHIGSVAQEVDFNNFKVYSESWLARWMGISCPPDSKYIELKQYWFSDIFICVQSSDYFHPMNKLYDIYAIDIPLQAFEWIIYNKDPVYVPFSVPYSNNFVALRNSTGYYFTTMACLRDYTLVYANGKPDFPELDYEVDPENVVFKLFSPLCTLFPFTIDHLLESVPILFDLYPSWYSFTDRTGTVAQFQQQFSVFGSFCNYTDSVFVMNHISEGYGFGYSFFYQLIFSFPAHPYVCFFFQHKSYPPVLHVTNIKQSASKSFFYYLEVLIQNALRNILVNVLNMLLYCLELLLGIFKSDRFKDTFIRYSHFFFFDVLVPIFYFFVHILLQFKIKYLFLVILFFYFLYKFRNLQISLIFMFIPLLFCGGGNYIVKLIDSGVPYS